MGLRELVLRPPDEPDGGRGGDGGDAAVVPRGAERRLDGRGRGTRDARDRRAARVAAQDGAPTVVVLAPADRALLAGAVVAAGLRGRAPTIAVWSPGDVHAAVPAEAPAASAAARRGREAAAGCGLTAVAVGRTVRAVLPDDDAQAVAAIERLGALPGRGPLVVVVAGPWGPAFLRLLERVGHVHADGTPATLAASARTLARHGVRVSAVPAATGPVARALLRGGWGGRAAVAGRGRTAAVATEPPPGEAGQALLLVLLGLTVAIVLVAALGAVAAAMGGRQERQRAVDVAALAAADRMRADWPDRAGAPVRLGLDAYRARAIAAARRAAHDNGLGDVAVDFPDPTADAAGPLSVRVRAAGTARVAGVALDTAVAATAELSPPAPAVPEAAATGDEYAGPLARRQGKPMRPDVAAAFDRMNRAATRDGHPLVVTSGYRSNAEQARLFAAHPDPKWVARPGTSLHRMGTELDLGPASAYGWLAANAPRFGFKKRYSWEPWHFGYVRDTGSAHVAEQGRNPAAPAQSGALPPWVPERFRAPIRAAAIRHKVSAALLAAQLRQESGFDPNARSPVGAQGIAQFMPGTARSVGLRDPFDPEQAIDAQAKLMGGLLRRLGSVQLALAAYNAGEGAVARYRGIPPFAETRQYVATIIALMRGYDAAGGLADALAIRLTA